MANKTDKSATCSCCGRTLGVFREFFKNTASTLYMGADGVLQICKDCMRKHFDELRRVKGFEEGLQELCCRFDIYYDPLLAQTALNESKARSKDFLGVYIRHKNNRPYTGYTYADSIIEDRISVSAPDESGGAAQEPNNVLDYTDTEEHRIRENLAAIERKNIEEVVNMLGYDPFYNVINHRAQLYSLLIDFCDESTLEDTFKLSSVIQICKSIGQCEDLNDEINRALADQNGIEVTNVVKLIGAKRNLHESMIKFAKDNGISINNSTEKSKGAGTLSGIIKKMQELKITESDVNMYDVETCDGIRQVADISNDSIARQLKFDENDYTEMISDQRVLIKALEAKSETMEEENRKLKIELKKMCSGV